MPLVNPPDFRPEKYNPRAGQDRYLARMLREIAKRDGLPGMEPDRIARALNLTERRVRKMIEEAGREE